MIPRKDTNSNPLTQKTLQLAKFNYFKEQLPSLSEQ